MWERYKNWAECLEKGKKKEGRPLFGRPSFMKRCIGLDKRAIYCQPGFWVRAVLREIWPEGTG